LQQIAQLGVLWSERTLGREGLDLDEDRLGLAPLLERLHASLATVAGGLVATERKLGGTGRRRSVDGDRAGVERLCATNRAVDVLGEDSSVKAVFTVVGTANGLSLVLKGVDVDNRAEDLVDVDLRLVVKASEDGGLK